MAVSDEVLIRAEGVSKKFSRNLQSSLRYGLQDVFCELRGKSRRSDELRPHEFWSLKDVSFEVRRGESVALIGRNGAGKSTLLQLLNGRLKLDHGRIAVRGMTGLVTELGAGFNPVQTGRENVYNSGAVLGMSKERIDAAYADMVEFAELEEAMDTPVQSYSSGMRARLGYAVVAFLQPDILMGDEVLAVGDLAFRRKCLQHMVRYLRTGGTLIVVAHDLYTVQSICTRCILLDHGKVLYDGPMAEGFNLYIRMMQEARQLDAEPKPEAKAAKAASAAPYERTESPQVVIDLLSIRGENGGGIRMGGDAIVEMRYHSLSARAGVGWGFTILTGDRMVRIASAIAGLDNGGFPLREGEGIFSCRISNLPLFAGTYLAIGSILDLESRAPLAEFGREGTPATFTVEAEVNEVNNIRAYLGNLIVVNVSWDP